MSMILKKMECLILFIVLAGGGISFQKLACASLISGSTTVSGVGTIAQGTTWDTNNHEYSSTDLGNMNNYSLVGGDSKTGISGSWFNLISDTKATSSLAIFNGAMDLTKNVSLSGVIRATTHSTFGTVSWKAAGDSLGYILTPVSISDIKSNLSNSTNEGLGIKGLPNSFFLGRDFYSNLGGVDGPAQNGWISGASNVIAIRKTDSSGSLVTASYASGNQTSTTTGSAWETAPDSTSTSSVISGYQQITEKINFQWKPDASNSASLPDYISGTLHLVVYDTAGSTIIADLTTHTSIYKTVSVGVVAATGEQYGDLSFSNIGNSTGSRGLSDVIVNYYKTGTTTLINNWNPSIIKANVFDTIGILAPGSTPSSSVGIPSGFYNYVAPQNPLGYLFNSISNPIQVQNHDSNNNPNQINIYYTPQSQSLKFSYDYSPIAQRTPPIPSALSFSGVTDQPLKEVETTLSERLSDKIPTGYYISKIITHSGLSYSGSTTNESFSSFMNSNPKFESIQDNNQYQILLSPLLQTGEVTFVYDKNVSEGGPLLPKPISISGLTGDNLTFSIPPLPAGYLISKVIGPDKISYPSVVEALSANSFYTAGVNDFEIVISAIQQIGKVSYNWGEDVPGYNNVPGKLQAKLPEETVISGGTGDVIDFTPTLPVGYEIDYVIGPDDKKYTDLTNSGMTALESAKAANHFFVNGSNDFTITLKASIQTVKLRIVSDNILGINSPSDPGDQTIVRAMVGSLINQKEVNSIQNWLDNWIKNSAIGWSIKNYIDPNGKIYNNPSSTLSDIILGIGGVVLADNNLYIVNITYVGSINFVSIPSTINFGKNLVTPSEQKYSGRLDCPLIISDTRLGSGTTPWTISVSQTSPIQEVIQEGVDSTGNPVYSPIPNGISFIDCLSYNNMILNSHPQVVYSGTGAETGTTVVIEANKPSNFYLRVPVNFQKINTKFEGSLSWMLTIGP